MKDFISWEHYEADREASIKDYVGFGLVFVGSLVVIGLAILNF